MFISFEGLDGSGKTLQLGLLCESLQACGYDVLRTREPGGVPLSEIISGLVKDIAHRGMCAQAEMYLMAASRAQHVAELIRPALAQGKVVVCDRYVDSSIAYQGFGRGLGAELVANINLPATGGVMPDVTILLDISMRERACRLKNRPGRADRLEEEGEPFHERVRAGFFYLAAREPGRIIRVDGERSPSEISAEIRQIVKKYLPDVNN